MMMERVGTVDTDHLCSPHGWHSALHVLTHKFHVINRRVACVSVVVDSASSRPPPPAATAGTELTAAETLAAAGWSCCCECDGIATTIATAAAASTAGGAAAATADVTTCAANADSAAATAAAATADAATTGGSIDNCGALCRHLAQVCRVLRLNGSAPVLTVSDLASAPSIATLLPADHGPPIDTQQQQQQLHSVALRKLVAKHCATATSASSLPEYDLVLAGRDWLLCVPLTDSPLLIPPFAYRIQHHSGSFELFVADGFGNTRSARWLRERVLPKVARWAAQSSESGSPALAVQQQSLSLVNTEQYHSLYQQLKARYGAYFVSIWPERTDPQKFVYEDVAIAAYLITIWRQRRAPKRFVDLGCGNGLLVHILSSEGYSGFGVDVRSRKIWQHYPVSTRLEVASVVASVTTTFPDCDWLIGNHSDELTPWLPVMAAATGPACCFFLLPCCTWNFFSKYQRARQTCSTYEDYIDFVDRVAKSCGFVVEHDRLRIPSTRRRCLIGRSRVSPDTTDVSVQTLHDIVTRMSSREADAHFRPRAASGSPVRNCTRLPRTLIDNVVRLIALHLSTQSSQLQDEPAAKQSDSISDDGRSQVSHGRGLVERGRGLVTDGRGQLSLSAVAELVGGEKLSQLRNQCGGLQTLLRNHSHVFCVRGGHVQLQSAQGLSRETASRGDRVKTRLCWLHDNLPLGCPLPAPSCRFAHGHTDLIATSPPPPHIHTS